MIVFSGEILYTGFIHAFSIFNYQFSIPSQGRNYYETSYNYEENKQIERFNMATVLLKADDGKYYKIQIQNDRSDIREQYNDKQYVVAEVNSLDIREIGGWEGTNYRGNKIVAIYEYYCPRKNGDHKVMVKKGEANTVIISGHAYIEMGKNDVWVDCTKKMTTRIGRRKMTVADLEAMADERGLRRGYMRTLAL